MPAERSSPDRRSIVFAAASINARTRGDQSAARLAREAFRDGLGPECRLPILVYIARLTTVPEDEAVAVLAEARRALDELAAASPEWPRWWEEEQKLLAVSAMVAYRSGDTIVAQAAADADAAITRDHGGGTAAAMSAFLRGSTRWQHDPEVALEALEESIALTKAGAGGPSYGSALSLIVRLRLRVGDFGEALARLLDALEYARSTQRYLEGIVLDQGAEIVAALGDLQAGAVLIGAAGARHAAFQPVTWLAVDDAARNVLLERVSAELGADGFEAAAARGAAMTDDEAVDYCVDALNSLIPAG